MLVLADDQPCSWFDDRTKSLPVEASQVEHTHIASVVKTVLHRILAGTLLTLGREPIPRYDDVIQ